MRWFNMFILNEDEVCIRVLRICPYLLPCKKLISFTHREEPRMIHILGAYN